MLERDAELVHLGSRLQDAGDGRGGVVVVKGPASIGKSMLLAAAGRVACELGLGLLKARAGELRKTWPSGPRQLLEPAFFSMRPAERRRVLAGPAAMGARAVGLQADEAPGEEFAACTACTGYALTSPRASRSS